MTFLTPTAGLIGAALTVPPLLLFYMLRLRRRPVRVSATMLWEQAATDLQANTPFRWLRTSWLLLLHLLILGSLLTALARPVLDAPAARARRVLIVLDTSASMSARDGRDGGTRLDEAKARAIELARALGSRAAKVEIGIISAAWTPTLELAPAASATEAVRAIERVHPTDQRDRLQPALDLAEALLRGPGDEEETNQSPALVVIYTDASNPEPLTISGAETRVERVGAAPSDQGAANTGIVALAARRDFRDPELLRIFVRLANAHAREITLSLTVELGAATARVPVTVPAARVETAGIPGGRWVPGERATSIELRSLAGGLLRVNLEGADLLESDNRASLVVRPPRPPIVTLVHEAGTTRAGIILEEIVRALAGDAARVVSPDEYRALAQAGGVREGEVIVFHAVSPATTPGAPSLSFGASIAGLSVSEGETGAGTEALWWEREHPALRAVALDALFAVRTLRTQGEGWRAIARGRAGPLLLESTSPGPKRLAAAFDLDQSTWPLHFSFAIFVAAAVEHLAGADDRERGSSFSTSEPARAAALAAGIVRAFAAGGSAAGEGTATTPGEEVSLGTIRNVGEFRLENARDEWLSVNLCEVTETACAPGLGLKVSGVDVQAQGGSVAGRLEAWPWFVLAAGVLLMIEWLVYGAKMRVR